MNKGNRNNCKDRLAHRGFSPQSFGRRRRNQRDGGVQKTQKAKAISGLGSSQTSATGLPGNIITVDTPIARIKLTPGDRLHFVNLIKKIN